MMFILPLFFSAQKYNNHSYYNIVFCIFADSIIPVYEKLFSI